MEPPPKSRCRTAPSSQTAPALTLHSNSRPSPTPETSCLFPISTVSVSLHIKTQFGMYLGSSFLSQVLDLLRLSGLQLCSSCMNVGAGPVLPTGAREAQSRMEDVGPQPAQWKSFLQCFGAPAQTWNPSPDSLLLDLRLLTGTWSPLLL